MYPALSPKKQFTSALRTLQYAANAGDGEAYEAIQEAARQVDKFWRSSQEASPEEVSAFEVKDLPVSLATDIEEALDVSHELARKLKNNPTVYNALWACKTNRRTVALMAIARLRYYNRERLVLFADDLS